MRKLIENLAFGLLLFTIYASPLPGSQKPDGSPFVLPTSIEIISVPEQAMVHIDGEKQGLTPYTAKDLTVGDHTLKIHKQGYEDHIQTFSIVGGPNKSIGVVLIKMTDATITTKPKGATLYLDGELRGTTPYKGELPTGKHILQLKLLGYADWEQETIIVEDYSNKVSLSKLFQINFSSDPIGAEVFMDNKYIGDTPFTGDYPAGKHMFKVQMEGYETFQKEMKLKKNINLNPELKDLKAGGGFFKKTLFLAAIVGGGYYYYITYVDTPQDAGFPNPPNRP